MNCYALPSQLAETTGGEFSPGALLSALVAASRVVDGPYGAGRHFFTRQGVRHVDGARFPAGSNLLEIPDCLGLTEVREAAHGTAMFAWALDPSEWLLGPEDGDCWPKTHLLAAGQSYWPYQHWGRWRPGHGAYRLSGVWGHGDGVGWWPWRDLSVTVTAGAAGESATASAAGVVEAGMTLLLGAPAPGGDTAFAGAFPQGVEQAFVSGVNGTALTLRRGVNGTAAAAHTGACARVALYPEETVRTALWLAAHELKAGRLAGATEVRIGDYMEKRAETGVNQRVLDRLLGRLKRGG